MYVEGIKYKYPKVTHNELMRVLERERQEEVTRQAEGHDSNDS